MANTTPNVPFRIAEVLRPGKSLMWDLCKQLDVQDVVTGVPEGPDLPPPWDFELLRSVKESFLAEGFGQRPLLKLILLVPAHMPACCGPRSRHPVEHVSVLAVRSAAVNILNKAD